MIKTNRKYIVIYWKAIYSTYKKRPIKSFLLIGYIGRSEVASRIRAMILSLNDGFLNRSVFVKINKFNLDIWGSILLNLLIGVYLLLTKKVHWRRKIMQDSTSMLQLHSGFNVSWKLCLELCFRKSFRPKRS